MTKEEYKLLVKKHLPKENKIRNIIIAFLVGGLIGLLAQGLTDLYAYLFEIPTKEAMTFTTVSLVFLGCLFTCLGFFDKWVHWARAGLIVPITGFAHSMTSAAIEFKKEGFVTGLGANLFKLAGTVILYGVVSAYFFGILRLIIMGGN